MTFALRPIPHLHVTSSACDGFLRFISGATPANHLTASINHKHLISSVANESDY